MTAIEVALLLIGVVFILGSFFIMEKLSPTELSRVAELSEDELRMVMDRELEITGAKISDMADQAVDLSMSQIQRKMEKDTNEKIMAISEYSDVVMEKLQKFNNEVTFLYSMLGDKHSELNESMVQLNDLLHACQEEQARTEMIQSYQESAVSQPNNGGMVESDKVSDETEEEKRTKDFADQTKSEAADDTDEIDSSNVREKILERYRGGEDLMDVARDMGIGYGEVKLIVELYKGEEIQ